MSNIKISVIIPVYNTQDYVEKCVNSILNQSLKDIEIILINDGSTDGSLEKLKKYEKDKRVMIINKKNEGVSVARNIGLEKAIGEYIYFIDADDYLQNNTVLEKIYLNSKNNNLDILIFDYYRESKGKKEYIRNFDLKNDKFLEKNQVLMDLMKEKFWGSIWNKLIRRELFLKNNIEFFKNLSLREDLLVVIKLVFFADKIGKLNEALYNYVQHDLQSMKKMNRIDGFNNDFVYIMELENFIRRNHINYLYDEIKSKKIHLYYIVFKLRNLSLKIHKKLKENYQNEDKQELYKCSRYRNMSLRKKIRLYIYTKLFIDK